MQEQTNDLKGI